MCILTLFESNIATFNTFGLYLVQSEYLGQAVTVYFYPEYLELSKKKKIQNPEKRVGVYPWLYCLKSNLHKHNIITMLMTAHFLTEFQSLRFLMPYAMKKNVFNGKFEGHF